MPGKGAAVTLSGLTTSHVARPTDPLTRAVSPGERVLTASFATKQSDELLRQKLQSLVLPTDRSPRHAAVPDAMTRPTPAEHAQSRIQRRLRMRRTTPVACSRSSHRPPQTLFRRRRSATLLCRRRTGAEASSWENYLRHSCPAWRGLAHPGAVARPSELLVVRSEWVIVRVISGLALTFAHSSEGPGLILGEVTGIGEVAPRGAFSLFLEPVGEALRDL